MARISTPASRPERHLLDEVRAGAGHRAIVRGWPPRNDHPASAAVLYGQPKSLFASPSVNLEAALPPSGAERFGYTRSASSTSAVTFGSASTALKTINALLYELVRWPG